MPYPRDDPSWAMLEALDLWGDAFLEALEHAERYEAWLAETPNDIALTLAMSSVTGDILNGGMDQCFWNPFGTAAPEAVSVLKTVGLGDYARLVEEAISRFGGQFPRSRTERMNALDTGKVQLADLDQELFLLIEAYDGEDVRRLNDFTAGVFLRHSN